MLSPRISQFVRPAWLIILCIQPSPGRSQDVATSGEINIQWQAPSSLFIGQDAVLHAGERLIFRAEGSVCIDHFHQVRHENWLFWQHEVVDDHHNYRQPDQVVPAIVLIDAENGAQLARMDRTVGEIVVPQGANHERTKARFLAYVPDVGPRGNSHGQFTLRLTIDNKTRITVLASALSGRRYTPTEIKDADFLDERTRKSHPTEFADLVLEHVRSPFYQTAQLQDQRVELLELACILAPQNPAVYSTLGIEQLNSGAYEQAGPNLQNAVKLARQNLTADPSNQPMQKTLGVSLAALSEFFEKLNLGLVEGDLQSANVLLAEAVEVYKTAGESILMRDALIRRARVLRRIGKRESLVAAVQCLDLARQLSSMVLH